METDKLVEQAAGVAEGARALAGKAEALMVQANQLAGQVASSGGGDNFVFFFTIFVLAVFVGYYVVWSVTPALHSPLMSVTNAISSVIIVGALIAAGPVDMSFAKVFGFIAVVLASINIFGGFIVSQRMLSMFRKK
ncbi:MAG: NAD(P) transhydrogenase subunit alpha [Proteobacteria bacterium]|nr:NAD(P) transhydrogenase subunit alpha [Pseudomonadota bacterium]